MRWFLPLLSFVLGCAGGFPTYEPVADDDDTPIINFDDDDATADDDDGVDDDDTADDDDATVNYEGDEPGECSDGADNDQDGLFDCDDPNCAGSPDCADDDDATSDDDDTTPSDDDDSTPLDDDDSTPLDDDDATDTFEGDEPGECADGIDNDGDFLTDCDDPTCNLTPECGGGDDDDATADPSGIPTITGIITSWLPATNQLQFDISMVDADCNLGDPILNWSFNGSPQPPYLLTGAGFTCGGVVTF